MNLPSIADRFMFELIWSARMLAGKEQLFTAKEKKLEKAVLSKKLDNKPAEQIPEGHGDER